MNAKEMNPLERHVEKIVLAVAAAGALYMGYLAMQPITIEGTSADDRIPVEQIETRLAGDIEKLKKTQTTLEEMGPITPDIPDYRNKYSSLIKLNPLPPALANAEAPRFGPSGVAVNARRESGTDFVEEMKVILPDPQPPELLSVEGRQQPVAVTPATAPGVAPVAPVPGTPVAVRDQNFAVIQGYIPVSKMLVQMAVKATPVPKNNPRLPDPLQRVEILRIEVERREKLPNSQFKPIPRSQAVPEATSASINWNTIPTTQEELVARMDQVAQEFKILVLPDFYPDDKGVPIQAPNLSKPPKEVAPRIADLMKEVAKIQPPSLIPHLPGGAANVSISPAPGSVDDPGIVATPTMTADVAALKGQALVPFVAWDDTVEPEHEYEYRVRVVYVNPGFNFARGLAKPELKGKAELASEWVKVPGSVRVKSDTMFFITGPAVGGGMGGVATRKPEGATAHVFKRSNGKWYGATFYVMPGLPIAGPVSLVDQPGKSMDVDTGYVLVDADTTGSNTHAVLIDNSGRMVTHDSSDDSVSSNAQHKELINSAEKAVPVTRPASTTPPTRGTPPARGPIQRTPPGRGTDPVDAPNP